MNPVSTLRAAPALAWVLYLPLGAKYGVWLAAVLACAWAHSRQPGPVRLLQQPAARPLLLLVGWLALSALWSPAPMTEIASHLGLYGLWLSLPLLAAAMPPEAARRALVHFCLASALVALLFVLHHFHPLPVSWWLHSTVQAQGNQRIANSLLLSLGAALGLWQATQASRMLLRLAWLTAAAVTMVGVSVQDRRTGMLLMPMLLLAWAIASQPNARRRLALALVVVAGAAAAWQAADGVRARFAEGLSELRQAAPAQTVASSWGQRLRMFEITADMVRERPLLGHGLGSWQRLWHQRTTPGTPLHDNRTPHNEYLLLAQQSGVAAGLLLLAVVATACRAALRAGQAGVPSLLLWSALAVAALFNAVLRDAKFALPLLLLAAAAAAAQRRPVDPPR